MSISPWRTERQIVLLRMSSASSSSSESKEYADEQGEHRSKSFDSPGPPGHRRDYTVGDRHVVKGGSFEQFAATEEIDNRELRCVVAVVRHGDRTPKEKMKMKVTHPLWLQFFKVFSNCFFRYCTTVFSKM